jgi:hypothetical protein
MFRAKHMTLWLLVKIIESSPCHIYIIKSVLRQKEELWKFKYFTVQKYNLLLQKKSSKRNQNPSRYYYNSIITNNLKFQHKPKLSSFQTSSYKNKPIIYYYQHPHHWLKVEALTLESSSSPLVESWASSRTLGERFPSSKNCLTLYKLIILQTSWQE